MMMMMSWLLVVFLFSLELAIPYCAAACAVTNYVMIVRIGQPLDK